MKNLLPLIILIFAPIVLAQSFIDGDDAYNAGDYERALTILRPLAEQGNAEAQFNLGIMYDKGRGVNQDDAEAVKWFRLAAEQGLAEALFVLGSMYETGHGVSQDYVRAHMWYNIAASLVHDFAIEFRDFVADKMTADQIAEAQRLARECVAKNYKNC